MIWLLLDIICGEDNVGGKEMLRQWERRMFSIGIPEKDFDRRLKHILKVKDLEMARIEFLNSKRRAS